MITLFIIFIVFSFLFLTFVRLQIRIREFRYELFKIRDEVRFAFISEISNASHDDRVLLRKQFIEIQRLINSMLKHPSICQAIVLNSMLKSSDREVEHNSIEEFNKLPMLFKRQLVFLIHALAHHMCINNKYRFFGFLFRLSFLLSLEMIALKLEGFIHRQKNEIEEDKRTFDLPHPPEMIRKRYAFKDYEPSEWAALLVEHSREIQHAY